eukprot:scaffold10851_cov155-Skeletonema_dohrnii-CCMP3373.AAC.10
MATINHSGMYHQRRERQLRRRNRMIDPSPLNQEYEAELVEEVVEDDKADIFLNMMEKSTAFFDTISMSDSVTPNPFVSATNMKVVHPSIYLTSSDSDLKDTRDASSTMTSPHMLGLVLDAERQAASPISSSGKSIPDSPTISVESIKMLDSDFEEISLSSAEHEYDEISLGSAEHEDDVSDERLGAVPRQDEANRELAVLEEKQNASPASTVKSNVTVDISDQALFDTDSDEIEDMEELHRHIDDVSTLTEETYSPILSNEQKPFFTPYSSQPFSFAEMQFDAMQKQDELATNRRRSMSSEVVYMQRLEEIAAQRSIIAQIAIKFEDVIMAVCGQEEEVLYVVVEEDEEEEEMEETGTDNKSGISKPALVCVPEGNDDV